MSTTSKAQGDGRALPQELLDDGQGKCEESTATATDGDSDMDGKDCNRGNNEATTEAEQTAP